MNNTRILTLTLLAATILCYGAEPNQEPGKETTLHTHGGPVKISPEPKLYDDNLRILITNVSLIKDNDGKEFTKITYKPWYGKINASSQTFREENETQSITILVSGDRTAKIKKDDIVRYCWYQN